jgi:hypothetical protein
VRVLTYADVPEHVRAQIRALKPTEQRARVGIIGDPSHMIAHEAHVDADCAEAFRGWVAGREARWAAAEAKAAAERDRIGKTLEELLDELGAKLRAEWQ